MIWHQRNDQSFSYISAQKCPIHVSLVFYYILQDTVVALQALSGLGEKIYVPNFKIAMNAKGNTWSGKTFNVDNSNSLVLQNEDVSILV